MYIRVILSLLERLSAVRSLTLTKHLLPATVKKLRKLQGNHKFATRGMASFASPGVKMLERLSSTSTRRAMSLASASTCTRAVKVQKTQMPRRQRPLCKSMAACRNYTWSLPSRRSYGRRTFACALSSSKSRWQGRISTSEASRWTLLCPFRAQRRSWSTSSRRLAT